MTRCRIWGDICKEEDQLRFVTIGESREAWGDARRRHREGNGPRCHRRKLLVCPSWFIHMLMNATFRSTVAVDVEGAKLCAKDTASP